MSIQEHSPGVQENESQPQQPYSTSTEENHCQPIRMPDKMSGGRKAGRFALGFFLGIIGLVITWAIDRSSPEETMREGLMMCLIGVVVSMAVGLVLLFAFGALFLAALAVAMA